MSKHVNRLGLDPYQRLIIVGGIASTYGFFHGVARGARLSSLQYLAENAHRLPRTKGTWYFFHKRKNMVILKDGVNRGVATAAKYSFFTLAFFGMEALIDQGMNRVSWISTTGSSVVLGSLIAAAKKLSWQQSLRSVRNFTIFGVIAGFVQDKVRAQSELSRDMRRQKEAQAILERAKEKAEEEPAAES